MASSISNFFVEEVEDAPVTDAVSKAVENPQEILFHLNELRKHLVRAAMALILASAFSFAFNSDILNFLAQPIGGMEELVAIEVTEPIGTVVRVSLLSGVAIAFPYIFFELWMFIAPGVSRRTRIFGLLALPIATIFFLVGMAFAYFVMLPTALPFLLGFGGIYTIPRPSSYIKFVTSLMFWIGVAFEFPLVVFLLAKIGLLRAEMLMQQWRLAIVIIAIAAAMITPTIDPVNMMLVMGPMVALYFLSVLLAKFAQRGRAGRAVQEPT